MLRHPTGGGKCSVCLLIKVLSRSFQSLFTSCLKLIITCHTWATGQKKVGERGERKESVHGRLDESTNGTTGSDIDHLGWSRGFEIFKGLKESKRLVFFWIWGFFLVQNIFGFFFFFLQHVGNTISLSRTAPRTTKRP